MDTPQLEKVVENLKSEIYPREPFKLSGMVDNLGLRVYMVIPAILFVILMIIRPGFMYRNETVTEEVPLPPSPNRMKGVKGVRASQTRMIEKTNRVFSVPIFMITWVILSVLVNVGIWYLRRRSVY